MKNKFILSFLLMLSVSMLLTSCKSLSNGSSPYYEGTYDDSSYELHDYAASGNGLKLKSESISIDPGIAADEDAKPTAVSSSGRKIIYTSDFSIQTKEYDASVSALKSLCDKYGAYFESSDSYGNENSSLHSNYTVRVPVENYTSFTSEAGSLGVVVYSSEYNEDITENYFDIEARLESAKLREERVLEILKNAADLDDVLALERELSDIRYEIESYTGSLRKYDSLISYSTVTISLTEVKNVSLQPEQVLNFGERIKVAFVTGIRNFTDGFENFAVFVSYHFIGIVILLAVAGAVCAIVVRTVQKSKKALQKISEENSADSKKDTEEKNDSI